MLRVIRSAVLTAFVAAVAAVAGGAVVQAAQPAAEQNGQAQQVRVTGVVRDAQNAIALPGVAVRVRGIDRVVYTDVDGHYSIDLSPGSHELLIGMDGYEERVVRVEAAEQEVTADVALQMSRFSEVVTVQAGVEALATSQEAQLAERRNAQVIIDNIGAQEMRRNGDSDAAAALARVTGLSLVDGQFVFVRGLGERYSNTTLNGAVLPTTEPDKKVVPLDLFPTGLLSGVAVVKSYTPDRSAEFAGGLVEVTALKAPSRPVATFSWSLGHNSLTTGKDVIGYRGGGGDWRGFDDGTRALPAEVPDRRVIRGGIYTPDVGVLGSELETIGRAFPNNWNLAPRSARPNQSGSATLGGRFGKLGFLGSYSQIYEEQFNREQQIFYRGDATGLSEFSNYDFEFATGRATVGAVGNLSFQANPNHRVTFENFYSHSGKDETRTFEGFNSDINTDLRNHRLSWVEEEVLTNGLTGEHFLPGLANSRIDWRVSVAGATRDEPDQREVLYERAGNAFILADESQSGLRMYNALDDDSVDVGVNWGTFGTVNRQPIHLKFGGHYVERDRDFSSRRFRFVPIDTVGLDLTQQAETLFAPDNIGARFEVKEETRTTDSYTAGQRTAAFYGMTDVALSGRMRLVAGLRVERFDQQVDTFDLFDFNDDPEVLRSEIEETDIFPAINLVFSPRPTHNVRVSFSQTVNRPEFREVAPFEFTDIVGGRAIIGNPNLSRALIQNYDVRYEIFPGAEEVLAASLFLKRFDDPIERIIEPTAQLRTSFTNADSARNVGFELEARRRLMPALLVGANYTWVDSTIELTAQAAQVQTSLERPLAGQSGNILNLFAAVTAGPVDIRALYNYFDSRISDVGSVGLPDIFEEGRGTVDLLLSTEVRRLRIGLSAENLTDAEYRYTQGDRTHRAFKLGRTFSVNLGFSAF